MSSSSPKYTDQNKESAQVSPPDTERSGISLKTTVPPTIGSVLLTQIESNKSSKGTLSTYDSWGQDLVLTHQNKPELIEKVAEMIEEDPSKVTIHIVLCNGKYFQAIFVDSYIQRSVQAKKALELVPWSEFGDLIKEAMREV